MMKQAVFPVLRAAALSAFVVLLLACSPGDLLTDIKQLVTEAEAGPAYYTLTVTATAGGTASPPGASTVQQDAPTSISATVDTGSGCAFAGWTVVSGSGAIFGNASNPSTTVTLSSGDVTIQAGFAQQYCDLTLQCAAGGTITAPVAVPASGTSSPLTVDNSDPTTITAVAAVGYTFAGWTSSDPGVSFADASSPSTTVALTLGDATVEATFLEAGTTWTKRTLPSKQNWSSVVHDGTQFVAIASGSANCAATSPDGITWTPRSLPSSRKWNSVAYGGGKHVAVVWWDGVTADAAVGAAAISSDGITWTEHLGMPIGKSWISVTHGNGVFVAVPGSAVSLLGGYNTQSNRGAVSSDGITWTPIDLKSTRNWYSVCYGSGKFVAVAYNSVGPLLEWYDADPTNVAAWSLDGYTWTLCTLPRSQYWTSVTCGKDTEGDDTFVAVAGGPGGSTGFAAVSHDGVNWTETTIPIANWQSVTYGNGCFVATPWNSSNKVARSVDGVNWQAYTLPASVVWESVTYGGGKFVAVVWGAKLDQPSSDVAATSP